MCRNRNNHKNISPVSYFRSHQYWWKILLVEDDIQWFSSVFWHHWESPKPGCSGCQKYLQWNSRHSHWHPWVIGTLDDKMSKQNVQLTNFYPPKTLLAFGWQICSCSKSSCLFVGRMSKVSTVSPQITNSANFFKITKFYSFFLDSCLINYLRFFFVLPFA